MPLVTAIPLLALATARDLERLGLAQKALQGLSLAQRLQGVRAATGRLITPIRKRYPTPLSPTLDLATVDPSGLTGGAVVSWNGGPSTLVQDYLLTFPSPTTYTLTPNAGAFGAVASTAAAWPGSLTVDGYTVTLTGTINAGDVLGWTTTIVQDPGIALAVAQVAAFFLLANRGVDPETKQMLKEGHDAAMAWAAALGTPGEGELDPSLDTDTIDGGRYGPLGSGQTSAEAWLHDGTHPIYPTTFCFP